MKTKANLYLLPTNKISNLYKTKERLFFEEFPQKEVNAGNHFLYITLPQSDLEIGKINEGDWYYAENGDFKKILQVTNNAIAKTLKREKVIATNNPDLLIGLTDKSSDETKYKHSPVYVQSISEDFINYYIEEYNKGDMIKEIEVELEKGFNGEPRGEMEFFTRLKLSENNEISIIIPENTSNISNRELTMKWWNALNLEEQFYKVIPYLKRKGINVADRHPNSLTETDIEDIWKTEIIYNREEVIDLLKLCYATFATYPTMNLDIRDNWIKENLK